MGMRGPKRWWFASSGWRQNSTGWGGNHREFFHREWLGRDFQLTGGLPEAPLPLNQTQGMLE